MCTWTGSRGSLYFRGSVNLVETIRDCNLITIRKINDSMPRHVLQNQNHYEKHNIHDISKVGCSLTYKENVDDTRESPTLQLLERMDEHLALELRI